jgi:hypothetical protein
MSSTLVHPQSGVAATTGDGTTDPPVRPFTTLVYEAEAGPPAVKLASAQVVDQTGASGGRVVEFTAGPEGEIQFRHISVPSAGLYRFAIYYAPGGDARNGHLAVGNGAPLTIAFAAGTGCCMVTTVETVLPPGVYTATLTVPFAGDNPPALDRVVISRP